MSTRRTAKVAEAIRQVVSTTILFGLRDPRVQHVTILRVETPVDLRTSKVYVSILGNEKTQRLAMKGLNAARGFLQSRIAEELDLRFTPVLTFILDQGVKKSIEASRLLRKLDVEDASRGASSPSGEEESDGHDDEHFDDDGHEELSGVDEDGEEFSPDEAATRDSDPPPAVKRPPDNS